MVSSSFVQFLAVDLFIYLLIYLHLSLITLHKQEKIMLIVRVFHLF